MLALLMMAVALGQATDGARQQPQIYDATFRPLRKSERSYAKNGPAGPYYPQRAYHARASGEGLLSCRVGSDGALEKCKLFNETPWNSNFAPAARIMAERKRIFVKDAPVGETILVRVPFALGAPATVEP